MGPCRLVVLRIAAAALAAAAIGAQASTAAFDRALQLSLAPSVVKIEAITTSGRYSLGSGVVVTSEQVVTNCHVTRDAVSIRVVRGALRHDVMQQRANVERDLCLLRVPELAAKPVELGDSASLKRRQALLGIGFTGGIGLHFSDGEVVALHRHAGSHVIQSSNGFTSGASGGGLFDAAGRLVGILTFRLRGGAVDYFSAPVAWVRQLIASDDGPFERVAPVGGRAFWEQAPPAQAPFLEAAALSVRGRWGELAQLAERWTAQDVDDAQAWTYMAQAYMRLDQPGDAVRAWQQVVALDDDDALAWQQLGVAYARSGRLNEARRTLVTLRRLPGARAQELASELAALIDNS
jgi:serine protease Do